MPFLAFFFAVGIGLSAGTASASKPDCLSLLDSDTLQDVSWSSWSKARWVKFVVFARSDGKEEILFQNSSRFRFHSEFLASLSTLPGTPVLSGTLLYEKFEEISEVAQFQLVGEASIDPLTKIANRGAFDQVFARMIDHARMTKQPLSMALIDLDRFKAINDTHGHPIGDRVLLCAANWLSRGLRHSDFIARYGGEEFAVLFRDTRLADVESRLNQVLGEIARQSYEYEQDGGTKVVRFTASAGAAEWSPGETTHDLVRRADEALYDAKRNGRNRVVARKRRLLGALLR